MQYSVLLPGVSPWSCYAGQCLWCFAGRVPAGEQTGRHHRKVWVSQHSNKVVFCSPPGLRERGALFLCPPPAWQDRAQRDEGVRGPEDFQLADQLQLHPRPPQICSQTDSRTSPQGGKSPSAEQLSVRDLKLTSKLEEEMISPVLCYTLPTLGLSRVSDCGNMSELRDAV